MDLATALTTSSGDDRVARTGRVKATGSNRLTVLVDGAELSLPMLAGTYAVNDAVLVLWDRRTAGGFVLGRVGQPPPPPPPPILAPPPTAYVADRRAVLPVQTGTYRSGSWRPTVDLYQGDYGGYGLNTGVAHYGDQLVALGAVLTQPHSVSVKYRRQRGGDYAARVPTFWRVAERVRGGAPGRIAGSADGTAVPVDGEASWTLPQAWATGLLDGSVGGLAIHRDAATPYVVLDGLPDDADALVLDVSFYRNA